MTTQHEWIDRFAARLAQLNVGTSPADFIARARERLTALGEVDPEDAATDEHAARPPEQETKSPPALPTEKT